MARTDGSADVDAALASLLHASSDLDGVTESRAGAVSLKEGDARGVDVSESKSAADRFCLTLDARCSAGPRGCPR